MGTLAAMRIGEATYFYVRNAQNDIVALVDTTGTTVVRYEYDSWGKSITISGNLAGSIGVQNPFRYKGYYYDTETRMYYVGSRYYEPGIRKFISADVPEVLTASLTAFTDKNLYTYCDSNPVMRRDMDGRFWETILDIVSLGTSIAEVVANPSDPWAWASLAGDTVDLLPFVTGVGETTKIVKAVNKIDDTVDTVKTAKTIDTGINASKKIHGNSLKSNKINYGYALVDRDNNIMKFGETINPKRRYTKKYLTQKGYTMKIIEQGSKVDIHYWQYDMNRYYFDKYGVFPPENKKGW